MRIVPAQLLYTGDLIQSLAWKCKAREQLPAPGECSIDSGCSQLVEAALLCALADSVPNCRETFLPANCSTFNSRSPLAPLNTSACVSLALLSSAITCAGAVATTFLPCMMLICAVGPEPSHCAVYSPAGSVVPFTCVGEPISKLPLCESLAAKALVANANTSVANMIRKNNVDFIYRSF